MTDIVMPFIPSFYCFTHSFILSTSTQVHTGSNTMLDPAEKSGPPPHGADSPKGRQMSNPVVTSTGWSRLSEDTCEDTEVVRTRNRELNLEDTNEIRNPHRHWDKTRDSTNACLVFRNGG